MRRSLYAAAVVTSLLVASSLFSASNPSSAQQVAAQAASSASAEASATSGPSGAVTLITGDRVEVMPGSPPRVIPAKGREIMRFRITTNAGRVRVIPLDAVGLLDAGKLDPRLFDVTTLLESGYDDARRGQLPLIVQRDKAKRAAAPTLAGTSARRELPSITGFSVQESKKDSVAFWESLLADSGRSSLVQGITKVWLNGIRRTTLDHSVPQIGVPAAWSQGLTGRGVTVAVVDSGIEAQHPDLVGKVAAAKNFVDEPAGDKVGHGTHVASTVAGTGAASDGSHRGVAPEARLLDAKVCGLEGCPEDAILAGMEWAAVEQKATVVNMSLGGEDSPGDDPLEQAINTLSAEHGTLFVVAAGNDGELGSGTIRSPGSAEAALTVGAVDRQDALAVFSSRGPTVGDSANKPDLTAPGVDIVAAKAAGTDVGLPVGEYYTTASGTSMATPHVAGAAAILLQQHPEWTGAQVKAALMASAKVVPEVGAFEQGAGRVDVARAVTQQVVASPTSVSFGLASWPHEDDPVQTKTITYRNSGSSAVTLDLELRVANQPAGLFTVSPSQVVVPAGGSAEATVTADTKPSTVPVGRYSGQLVATGAGASISTSVGVEKEIELYDIQLTHIGRDGNAPQEHITFFDRIGDCGADLYCGDYTYGAGTGTSKLRLRPGEYTIGDFSTVTGSDWSLLMQSVFEVRQDGSVVLDAQKAKPVQMSVPRATARLMELSVVVARDMHRGPNGVLTYFQSGNAENPLFITELGAPVPVKDDVVSVAYGRFAEPGPAGDFTNSPYEYNLADYELGRALDGVQLKPRQGDFAAVKASYAADTDEPRVATTGHRARAAGATLDYPLPPADAIVLKSALPFQRTEFYLAEGLTWSSSFVELSESDETVASWLFTSESAAYQPGRSYRQDWNKGVSGPRLTRSPVRSNGLARGAHRSGDELLFGLSLRSDSNPVHMNEPKLPAGSARLYRNGELVEDWPRVAYIRTEVPAADASYRLESEVEVDGTAVSTKISTAWTFRSGHVDGVAALPFMAVHFTPALDDRNHARAGAGYTIPITVQRQPGAPTVKVETLTVDISTDDGVTWRSTKVEQADDGWRTEVTNPAAGAVSLRATATDAEGNKVEQTIIRGYLVSG
jgi:subtilisin family serine protease